MTSKLRHCTIKQPQTSAYTSTQLGDHPGLLVTCLVLVSLITNYAPIIILASYQFINSLS